MANGNKEFFISVEEFRACQHNLVLAFRSAKFVSSSLKRRLYDSYKENLEQMIEYAHLHNLDSCQYIRSISTYLDEYTAEYMAEKRKKMRATRQAHR